MDVDGGGDGLRTEYWVEEVGTLGNDEELEYGGHGRWTVVQH